MVVGIINDAAQHHLWLNSFNFVMTQINFVSMIDQSRTPVDLEVAASCSGFIKEALEASEDEGVKDIDLNATKDVIEEVIAFMASRKGAPTVNIPKPLPTGAFLALLPPIDSTFVSKWNTDMLIELIKVSNHLDFPALKSLSCAALADIMSRSTADEVRAILGVKQDLTEEEEWQLRDSHGIPQLTAKKPNVKKEEPAVSKDEGEAKQNIANDSPKEESNEADEEGEEREEEEEVTEEAAMEESA